MLNNKSTIIFIVGVPRSGTTYAQSLVATSKNVITAPETHYFTKCQVSHGVKSKMGVLWKYFYCVKWLHKNGYGFLFRPYWKAEDFALSFFNKLCSGRSKYSENVFLEKTPGHLNKVDEIKKVFPNAKFLHVVRGCGGNVNSLVKAEKKWGGEGDDIKCFARWISEVSKSYAYEDKFSGNHVVVEYEAILAEPMVLERKLKELGVAVSLDLSRLDEVASAVVSKSEMAWKGNNLKSYPLLSHKKVSDLESGDSIGFAMEKLVAHFDG